MENKLQKIKKSIYYRIRSWIKVRYFSRRANQKFERTSNYSKWFAERFYRISLTKRRASKIKRSTQTIIRCSSEGIKSNQTRTRRKRSSKASSCEPETFTQAWPNDICESYKELIKAAEGPTSINLRTRIALCILAVTGVRINELLLLKVRQLKTLFEEN